MCSRSSPQAPTLGAVARDARVKDVRRVLLRRTRGSFAAPHIVTMQSDNVPTVPALSKHSTRAVPTPAAPPTTAIVITDPTPIEVNGGGLERGTASVLAPVAWALSTTFASGGFES